MSTLWIRVDANIGGKDVVWKAAEFLRLSHVTSVGHLVTFWGNVAQHAEGGFIRDKADAQIERWADWAGEPGLFAKFIREQCLTAEGNIKRWDEMQGALEERRKKERERKQRQREREKAPVSHADIPQDVTRTSRATERNVTERKEKKTKRPRAARVAEAGETKTEASTWLTPCGAVWESRMGVGTFPWKIAAGALKRLSGEHPPDDIAAHLGEYLDSTKPDFVNLHRFAQTFAKWKPEPLIDPSTGWFTPKAQAWYDGLPKA